MTVTFVADENRVHTCCSGRSASHNSVSIIIIGWILNVTNGTTACRWIFSCFHFALFTVQTRWWRLHFEQFPIRLHFQRWHLHFSSRFDNASVRNSTVWFRIRASELITLIARREKKKSKNVRINISIYICWLLIIYKNEWISIDLMSHKENVTTAAHFNETMMQTFVFVSKQFHIQFFYCILSIRNYCAIQRTLFY